MKIVGIIMLVIAFILLTPLYDKYVDFMLSMPMGKLYKREKLEQYGKFTAIILLGLGTIFLFFM